MSEPEEIQATETQAVRHDVGVVALLPDTLEGPWMGRHQILTRLAKSCHVVWVNPAGEWRDYWKRGKGFRPVATCGFSNHPSGLKKFDSGKWLPTIYKPEALSKLIHLGRFHMIVSRLKAQGCRKFVLYITRPGLMPKAGLRYFDLTCYHVFDDYSFSDKAQGIDPVERELIEHCNMTFFSSEIMLKEKGGYSKNPVHLPNGVDLSLYAKEHAIPQDLAEIPRPIIGYSGVIKRQLNLRLSYELARRHEHLSFVFVGPVMNISGVQDVVTKLQDLKNVYFLGNKKAEELPAYIKNFDVATMCYVKNNYTKYINPLKLNEYMAAGINIVASDIEPLQKYRNCIYLADSVEEWSESLRLSLQDSGINKAMREEAKKVVANFDWNMLTEKLEGEILQKLS